MSSILKATVRFYEMPKHTTRSTDQTDGSEVGLVINSSLPMVVFLSIWTIDLSNILRDAAGEEIAVEPDLLDKISSKGRPHR